MAMRFRVRLTPKGGRDAIEGWWTDGAGRRAEGPRCSAARGRQGQYARSSGSLARTLDVRKSDVRIASGAASRVKMIEVEGDEALLAARLAKAVP